jgi:iron complex outermembrane receptor protein
MWRSTIVPGVLGGAAFVSCVFTGGPALAQAAASPSTELTEVIVTAQRREQRNIEVPVSIVSQSAEQLTRANVTSTMNLDRVVPGLLMNRVGAPTAPAIRGVSTKVANPGADANVSVYLDGFYQANAIALNRSLLDVANVEVLRGPQGTLFGRNSTGGAILITTRKPSHDPVFLASASLEENDGRKFVAYGSTGLTDKLAVGISASYTASDGWLRNRAPGPVFPTAPTRSNYVRGRVLFEPTDKITLDASYEHGFMDDGTATTFSHTAHPLTPGVFPLLHTDPRETSLRIQSHVKDIWDAYYLTASADLGFAVLKSMTQVREDNSSWSFDLDGAPGRFVEVRVIAPEKLLTQEVNLTSSGEGPLQWIVGAFYLRDKSSFRISSPSNNAYGAKTWAWAGYADATYQISDRLYLTAGVRYSEEKKRCLSVRGTGATGQLLPCTDGDPDHKEHSTTPRANIRYQIDDRTSVYVSYSKGFKSGGFNDARASAPYDPEKITDWEAGFKTARGAYQFELSAFHYDYKNLQFVYACTVIAPPICPLATGVVVTNAAAATSYGAETQISWQATENIKIYGGLAYLHSRYDKFLNASAAAPRTAADTPPCVNPNTLLCPNVAVGQDWSGQTPIRSPKWSGNIGVSATLPTSIGAFTLDANVSYVDDFQSDTDSLPCITTNCGRGLRPRLVIPDRALVDATLSWRSPDERIELALYARNLFDKDYIMRTDGSTVGDYVIGGEPRVVGVRVSYAYQ